LSAGNAPDRGSLSPAGLAAAIQEYPLESGEVMLCWLGQAGFAIRSASVLLVIDPYLSRLAPAPVAAAELTPDLLLVTHSHVDHFDVPAITTWAARRTHLIAPAGTVRQAIDGCGWDPLAASVLTPGETIAVGGVELTATFARHSDSGVASAETIGFLVRVGGITIWHAGDTVYDERLRRIAPLGAIDLALLPINGTGGNMNAHEAALLAWQLAVRTALPMHFGMWADDDYTYQGTEPGATLDPRVFADTFRRLAGVDRSLLAEVGRPFIIRRLGDALYVSSPDDFGRWATR
jgi:L-ascorbate 6-phosphate lactonase